MLINSEITDEEFDKRKFSDMHRLIFGDISQDENQTYGLINHTENMTSIIDHLPENLLEKKYKHMLKTEILQRGELIFSKSENRLDAPHKRFSVKP